MEIGWGKLTTGINQGKIKSRHNLRRLNGFDFRILSGHC